MDLENKYGLLDLQKELLSLLDKFNTFCKSHDIKYSLAFGSLLGAIRHKGFIPWDDDIDIMMDRQNYNIFVNEIKKCEELLLIRNTDKALWIPRIIRVSKSDTIINATIDIFIVDKVPDLYVLSKLKYLLILFIQGMIKNNYVLSKGTITEKIGTLISFIIGRFFPDRLKYKLFDIVSNISNQHDTKECSIYNVEYKYVGRKYTGKLLKEIVIRNFEDLEIPITNHYDSYLKTLYGNYSVLPDVKSRIPKHNNLTFQNN